MPIFLKSNLNKKLIRKGIIVVGMRTNINNLKINIPTNLQKRGMVIIGDDCIVHGSITIYSEKATITIGNRVYIGADTTLFCYDKIVFKDDILVSWGCTFIDTNAHAINWDNRKNDVRNWQSGVKDWSSVEHAAVVVENRSWVGFNSIILKGVVIGEESIVAAGSVVTKVIPSKTVVGGNPAVFIKTID